MSEQDRLPPLQMLSVFESAARLASFTAAARELGSTQPAVSQRIVQLEADLGVPLFERGHRGVTLTADGRRLYEAVRQSIGTIRDAVIDIRASRAKGALTILTDAGFATYWLVPRLMDLRRLLPDINVKVVTSQSAFDPRRDHADVAIAFGDLHRDAAVPRTSRRGLLARLSPAPSGDRPACRFACGAVAARAAHRTGALARMERMVLGAWPIRTARRARFDLQQLRARHARGGDASGRGAGMAAAGR